LSYGTEINCQRALKNPPRIFPGGFERTNLFA
jgi:hypothetical protein